MMPIAGMCFFEIFVVWLTQGGAIKNSKFLVISSLMLSSQLLLFNSLEV